MCDQVVQSNLKGYIPGKFLEKYEANRKKYSNREIEAMKVIILIQTKE